MKTKKQANEENEGAVGDHTPTPWHVNGNDIFSELHTVARMVYSAIPEDEQESNAAFIVQAVNCHEELLSCLKAFMECGMDDEIKEHDSLGSQGHDIDSCLLCQARQVIAKAEDSSVPSEGK